MEKNDKEFNKLMDFLADDEEEAIKGYDDVISKIDDKHVVKQLEKIRQEEENHLKFLRAVKEDHKLSYVDEHEDESNETTKSKILEMFGLSDKKGE